MTTTFIWQDLKQLVVIDYEITQLQKANQKEQDTLTNALNAHKKQENTLLELETTIRTIQKEIDRNELSNKDLRGQRERKKNQLASLIHTKERTALEHEITKLTTTTEELDITTIGLMEQQEAIQESLSNQKKIMQTSHAELKALEAKVHAHHAENNEKIKTLEEEWQKLLENLQPQLRSEYLQLKKRVKNPAVPIVENSCSACFMRLLESDSSHLTTRSVIKCRDCFRFLYIPDATTEKLTP